MIPAVTVDPAREARQRKALLLHIERRLSYLVAIGPTYAGEMNADGELFVKRAIFGVYLDCAELGDDALAVFRQYVGADGG